ncbi:succinate dehydrogenase assembly factor 2, mitochondrial isoform X2 [Lingula anatina]|uniref:Succinate dehydrogenase assembly factor 2, mitochondrial n=1 Tax=Lingula anatina TaxID=7574 RepID=A0A1S3J7M9_LINAN|nr:succinate dehydrogenase assembly factor 2, mitochondrial-like [Lingula anatina]XP_013406306.1 succinate dehydrogenase assembly factor 2, mitochondrial isoform X1 [Lingula anatina]XP_013406313.1 succinate dehydrogenase assembly factor 2, mitochondrial isoform X2 [Lingula anatina]|eukprot:XP_013400575.1 succinate dehydrogenase assembly factor 2, mitochondrial-like [Lingula anatina]
MAKRMCSAVWAGFLRCKTAKPTFSNIRLMSSESDQPNIIHPMMEIPPIPPYPEKLNEPVEERRARLLYQSRKRGMSENGLLLSTFASKYLNGFDERQLKMYDHLINQPDNDWDIYYWITGVEPTPPEYENEIMDLLKEHTKNDNREERLRQPDLP